MLRCHSEEIPVEPATGAKRHGKVSCPYEGLPDRRGGSRQADKIGIYVFYGLGKTIKK